MIGLLNLDKPAGPSSAACVGRVKRMLPRGVKIGHAGTLDPFATGVLVLLIGKATRLSEHFMGQRKGYDATVKLGAVTPTLDPESPETVTPDARSPSREQIDALLPRFVGEVEQMPPQYSALKVGGRRAYALARGGAEVELKARVVRIYGIEVLSYHWPLLRLRIDCGRGTYVRSIARDIGLAFEMGAYLTELRRTRVGPFTTENAVALAGLTPDNLPQFLTAPESVLPAPGSS